MKTTKRQQRQMAHLSRRGALQFGVGAGLAASIPWQVLAEKARKPKFLITLTATGGASIIDSFLAIRASESANASTIHTFPDQEVQSVAGSPFRAVDLDLQSIGPIPLSTKTRQSEFVAKHMNDMMVVTLESTSVNHTIAQERSLTGNDAWSTRTLQEAVASYYGQGKILPNVNMASGGFLKRGLDENLNPSAAYEFIPDPASFSLALHGSAGITGLPDAKLIGEARKLRQALDSSGSFLKTFGDNALIRRWREITTTRQAMMESQNLIAKLGIRQDSPDWPISAYGIGANADLATIGRYFPNSTTDQLQAQALLTCLMIVQGASVTTTLGPTFNADAEEDPTSGEVALKTIPLGFDFSHTEHKGTQAFMWQEVLNLADSIIAALKSVEFETSGESFWDRTMIYIATDFGRTKNRPANATSFSSGHDLNNGVLILSPMVNGNRILGGVNPDTALTYGFDLRTGEPDKNRKTTEAELFAGILQALEVDTSGSKLPDVRAMRKKA